MQNHSDAQLLRQYAGQRSEAAFGEIVARHAGLVYAAALRQLESPELARDVAQSVFTELARKAPSLADKLSGDASLAGWLYRSTRFAARDAARGDRRRQARERQVMQQFDATAESAPQWEQVRPVLDEAMAELSEEDREAVLLRYFAKQDLHAVGTALGVSDDAAQKRVSRALERLRAGLANRGVTTTTGALSALLVTGTVSFAPAGMAATLSATALAGTTLTTAATATATKAIAMTTLQRTMIAAALVVLLLVAWLLKRSALETKSPDTQASFTTPDPAVQQPRASPPQSNELLDQPRSESVPPPQYVEITGQIELLSYGGSDTNEGAGKASRVFSFVCVAGTREWRIENDFPIGGEAGWYFDGTNVYQSMRVTKPPATELANKRSKIPGPALVPFEVARSNLTIHIRKSHDGHPLGGLGANIPWLAFCSGTSLKRDGRLVPLPCNPFRLTPDRFAYADETQTFDDEFGLPRTVDLFLSSIEGFQNEQPETRRYRDYYARVVTNLPDGALTFHYAVTESTNFLGSSLPTRFEFFQIGRKYVVNGDWFCRGVGTVQSIRESLKPVNLFVPSLRRTIIDWRFRDPSNKVDSIMYASTNSSAAATNDPALQSKLEERAARMKQLKRAP